jgi:hypothetical protein
MPEPLFQRHWSRLLPCSWDTDMMLHDDIYKYFKSGPLSSLQWICGDEDPSHLTCNGTVDPHKATLPCVSMLLCMFAFVLSVSEGSCCDWAGGTNYIQNAAPDGPSAWVASSITERVRSRLQTVLPCAT